MGALTNLGNNLGLGDLDRSQNEFRDPNRANFNLPGYGQRADALDRYGNSVLDRQAPQSANDSIFRNYQGDLADRLSRLSRGEDSITRGQLQQAQDQMATQQRGMAAGALPGNSASARRWAAQNIARGNQGLAFNQSQAGIAERNAATGALSQLSYGARGQDLQNNQFNVGADQRQQELNQQAYLASQGLGLQNAQSQQQGGMGYEGARTNRFDALMTQPTTGERALGAIGGAVSAGGQIAGLASGNPAAAGLASTGGGGMSPGYTPGAFQDPMQLQTGQYASPYTPTAQGTGYTPGAFGQPMRFAEGGVVTKPTQALIGEAGPEAVIPLHKLPDLIQRLSQAVSHETAPGDSLNHDNGSWRANDAGSAPITAPPGTKEKAQGTWRGAYFPPISTTDSQGDVSGRTRRTGLDRGPTGYVNAPAEPTSLYLRQPMKAEPSREAAPAPSLMYGPPRPPVQEGPAVPAAGQGAWRPRDAAEYEMYKNGVNWKGMRQEGRPQEAGGMFQGGMGKMSREQWLAFLHGLGVQ